MNVEVVDFYLIKRNDAAGKLEGEIRIRLPDFGLHLLGIYVSKSKDFWFFKLPGGRGTHHQTGKSVRFPFFSFEDKDQHREFMNAVRLHGQAFIEKKLLEMDAMVSVAVASQDSEGAIN
jgi:hypothetical protein